MAALVLGLWVIIGLALWIPFVLRAGFMAALKAAWLLIKGKANEESAKLISLPLASAITFYVNGFFLLKYSLLYDPSTEITEITRFCALGLIIRENL